MTQVGGVWSSSAPSCVLFAKTGSFEFGGARATARPLADAGVFVPAAGGGMGEGGAGAVPHLAARRDGGADADLRVPARRGDGEGGRVPGRAQRRRHGGRPAAGRDAAGGDGVGDDVRRAFLLLHPGRPQAAAGVLDDRPPRLRAARPRARRARLDRRRCRAGSSTSSATASARRRCSCARARSPTSRARAASRRSAASRAPCR